MKRNKEKVNLTADWGTQLNESSRQLFSINIGRGAFSRCMDWSVFDGSPIKWLEFVVKFKDLVYDLQFLTNMQRKTYLLQHLEGKAKRAVQCFSNDKVGYIMAVNRLKYFFCQKPQICQAYRRWPEGSKLEMMQQDFDGVLLYHQWLHCGTWSAQLHIWFV